MSWVAVAVGAAAGAGLGAIAGSAQGGDAVWKGALTGAVAGAVSGGTYAWAAPAMSGLAAGALAGGAGGLTSGALGTALNGGNSNDYLRNMFTQGATGALLGGAGGAAFGGAGGEAAGGVNPVTGEVVNTAAPEITALPEGDLATGINTGATAAPGIEQTVSGTVPQTQAPTLQDTTNTLAGNQYAAANTGTMTDIGGSSATPQQLPGGVDLNATSTPDLTSLGQQGQQQAQTSMQQLGLGSQGEGTTVPATANTSMAPATQEMNQSPTGFWDKYLNKGTGKMELGNYLNKMGQAQLIGGGLKTLGAIATAPETQANKQALMDLYNQQNQQNQFYANQLQQTYQNPQSYLGSPEAQATRSAALQKALATNAAAGRRTQGAALQNQLMMNQLQNLNAYRQGMPRPNYGTAAQVYQNAAQYSPTADIFGGLASGVTPLSLMSLYGA